MPATLHIANKNYSSWSLRPWVLMRELAIPFDERLTPFGDPTALRAFSPTGKVPCLVDGEVTVWDSLAIAEYLAERRPDVWPHERVARAWARCAAAEMHSGFASLRATCGMNVGVRVRIDPFPQGVIDDCARLDALFADGLARFGGPFLAGARFTAVDAFFCPVAFRAQTYAPPLSALGGGYLDALLALPSMRAWQTAALVETWRDPPHEEELRRVGTITADLRG